MNANDNTASISWDNGQTWEKVEIFPIATDLPEVGQLIAIGNALPQEAVELLKAITKLEASAQDLVICDNESLAYWDKAIGTTKGWGKEIEEGRKRYTRPIDVIKAEMMDRVRPITDRLTALTQKIGAAITEYYKEQRRLDAERDAERQEQQRKQREEMALAQASKLEAQGRTEQAARVLTLAANTPAAPVMLPPTVPTKIGNVRMQRYIDWMIENPDELPRQYLMPNEKLIQAQVQAFGLKHGIPGVAAWEDEKIAAISSRRR